MLSLPDFREKTIVFAMLSREDRISFKNDNLVIRNNGKIKHQSSCYRLFALFIVGHMTMTTGLLQKAKKFGFSIVFLTHTFKPYACWNIQTEGNVLLRQKQYEYSSLGIAQHLVNNKIFQQANALKQIREKNELLWSGIASLEEHRDKLSSSSDFSLHDLLGIEGSCSRIYFSRMFAEMNWQGRKPRVKHDITNSLLDMGYTLLFNVIEALLGLYGFDLYKGVYHQEFYQRKSLVCDIVEPFRTLVDYQVRKAHKLNQINSEDFTLVQRQYLLSWKEGASYSSWLLKPILGHKEQIFSYVQEYYRAFIRSKPIEEYPVFVI